MTSEQQKKPEGAAQPVVYTEAARVARLDEVFGAGKWVYDRHWGVYIAVDPRVDQKPVPRYIATRHDLTWFEILPTTIH